MDDMTEPDPFSAGEYSPADRFTVTSLEQLRVLADPLRQRIIDALQERARTVKQVAAQLGKAPTKLYYHFKLLEEHGFIVVAETRVVSSLVEKQYRASARAFLIPRTLLNPHERQQQAGAVQAMLDAVFEPVRAEISSGIQSGRISTAEDAPETRRISLWREMAALGEAEALDFHARLTALIEEFRQHGASAGAASAAPPHYELLIALYPARPPGENDAPAQPGD
jgi:DNA-binding transcriptional ArsR family regulator